MACLGSIDFIYDTAISGWAADSQNPEASVLVSIYFGDILLGEVEAKNFRHDLKQAGIGSGYHGFEFETSADFDEKKIRVVAKDFQQELPNNTKKDVKYRSEDRNYKLFSCIIPGVQRGIEFGPLHDPLIRPSVGNIRYIDHASTNDLKKKYARDPVVNLEKFVNVDYVWTGQPLKPLIGDYAPVDYVVASHVIEHVPNPIGWFHQIHSVLKPGGVLALAIPDKRFCFDCMRRTSEAHDLIGAYLAKLQRPSATMVFDHYSNVVNFEGRLSWNSWDPAPDPSKLKKAHSLEEAIAKARSAAETEEYFDAHCWVFTPESFLDILSSLVHVGLLPFRVCSFHDVDGSEFFVSLQSLPQERENRLKQAKLASIALAKESIKIVR